MRDPAGIICVLFLAAVLNKGLFMAGAAKRKRLPAFLWGSLLRLVLPVSQQAVITRGEYLSVYFRCTGYCQGRPG
jgi:hypothetical protein